MKLKKFTMKQILKKDRLKVMQKYSKKEEEFPTCKIKLLKPLNGMKKAYWKIMLVE